MIRKKVLQLRKKPIHLSIGQHSPKPIRFDDAVKSEVAVIGVDERQVAKYNELNFQW